MLLEIQKLKFFDKYRNMMTVSVVVFYQNSLL